MSVPASVDARVAGGRMSRLQLHTLELREIHLPLKAPFETSFGTTRLRRILIVRAFDASGAVGFGECTASEEPFFNHETIDTAWLITAQFIAPLLAAARPAQAALVRTALLPIRENRMAKAGVETAAWDLEAKLHGVPLWRHLGGTRPEINCGVSIGLQETIDALVEAVGREVESGYQRIKIKIKPGRDRQLVEAIRSSFPAIALSVDANGAYDLDEARDRLRDLDRHHLMMIEQPLPPASLHAHSRLQREIQTPICLDESIASATHAEDAHALGACRIINIKLGRVGGHAEAGAIERFAAANSIPVWCGGMLESGIGRAHNIAMSTLPGFTLPGDISASARYWAEDIVEPPVTVSQKGTIAAPSSPGIGYTPDEARLDSLTVRREEIRL